MKTSRRQIIKKSAVLFSAAALHPLWSMAQVTPTAPRPTFNFFTKSLVGLPYAEAAARVAEVGYDGVELAIRKRETLPGMNMVDELPKMVAAYRKENLAVVTVTTDFIEVSAADRTEEILRTAQQCGVKRFRMDWYRYDNTKPIWPQWESFRAKFRDLVMLAKQIGIQPTYQNHSGAKMAGAGIWDIALLMKEYPATDVAWAFDLMHAKVEAGLSWPTTLALARDRLGVVQFKNAVWEGKTIRSVPLTAGIVDKDSVSLLKKMNYQGPCIIHNEYWKGDVKQPDYLATVIKASKDDLDTLRGWWA